MSSIVATRSAISFDFSVLVSLMIIAGDIKKILLRLKILSTEFSDQVVANA